MLIEIVIQTGDEYRIMPGCKHRFHSTSCIDKWLKTSDECPTCRKEVQMTGAKLDCEDSWDFADRLDGACGVKANGEHRNMIFTKVAARGSRTPQLSEA
jgi:hypothetical protein